MSFLRRTQGGVIDDENIYEYVSIYLTTGGHNFFDKDISEWDVSNVTNMDGLFENKNMDGIDITKWNLANVTSMENIFNGTILIPEELPNFVRWMKRTRNEKDYFSDPNNPLYQKFDGPFEIPEDEDQLRRFPIKKWKAGSKKRSRRNRKGSRRKRSKHRR